MIYRRIALSLDAHITVKPYLDLCQVGQPRARSDSDPERLETLCGTHGARAVAARARRAAGVREEEAGGGDPHTKCHKDAKRKVRRVYLMRSYATVGAGVCVCGGGIHSTKKGLRGYVRRPNTHAVGLYLGRKRCQKIWMSVLHRHLTTMRFKGWECIHFMYTCLVSRCSARRRKQIQRVTCPFNIQTRPV